MQEEINVIEKNNLVDWLIWEISDTDRRTFVDAYKHDSTGALSVHSLCAITFTTYATITTFWSETCKGRRSLSALLLRHGTSFERASATSIIVTWFCMSTTLEGIKEHTTSESDPKHQCKTYSWWNSYQDDQQCVLFRLLRCTRQNRFVFGASRRNLKNRTGAAMISRYRPRTADCLPRRSKKIATTGFDCER